MQKERLRGRAIERETKKTVLEEEGEETLTESCYYYRVNFLRELAVAEIAFLIDAHSPTTFTHTQ